MTATTPHECAAFVVVAIFVVVVALSRRPLSPLEVKITVIVVTNRPAVSRGVVCFVDVVPCPLPPNHEPATPGSDTVPSIFNFCIPCTNEERHATNSYIGQQSHAADLPASEP
jgi:hypothetical protein